MLDKPGSITIATAGNAPIVSKEDYIQADMTAIGPDETIFSGSTRIRGRGNSTWGFDKKPYKIKLDSKTEVLAMPKAKEWAFLANYSDKTMLRNATAFCLGRLLGMAHVPRSKFAELRLNDEYLGLYLVTEQIEAGASRVPVDETYTDISSGYLLEIDERLDGDQNFLTTAKVPMVLKSEATEIEWEGIKVEVNAFEEVLFGSNFADESAGYAAYLDVDAFIDFYFVNEIMKNNDAFFSSTFFYKNKEGRFVFGPLWDFDIAAGNIDYNGNGRVEGFWVRQQSVYMKRLLEDPNFVKKLNARWEFVKLQVPELQAFISHAEGVLDGAQKRNFQRWNILNKYVWPNNHVAGSYAGEVKYLKKWLEDRANWLDQHFEPIGAAAPQ